MKAISPSCRNTILQRRGVTSFAVSVRMTRARLTGQRGDGAGSLAAVFAGVFRSFIAFVQSVSAFADSIGVARTGVAGQRLDARKSDSAVFAVELCHDERFLFDVMMLFGANSAAKRLVRRSVVLSG